MLIWFKVMVILYCGLLGMCSIFEFCVDSGSYTYFMNFSSKEHVLDKCTFSMALLHITILSMFNVLIPYVVLSLKVFF